ncbi:hypothetical protein J4T99_gp107 [Mycobacterium phage Bromden]|uniref:Uncharacterized protein n=1 Tax=Mycobacterium phage Bromden TaxID=2283252 RepID=A0A345MBP0_9CAUD|nr:hypothetical protein J4T99_gp107 [Mycobacterium phage Bromden]AXH67911.1 hypothetical protein SEA_BROMDEN_107 [Mycobacterium phage Bromden]
MPNALNFWGPLPTREQCEELVNAIGYDYEAGEYPDDMSDFAKSVFDQPDGGFLVAFSWLKRAVSLIPAGTCTAKDCSVCNCCEGE